MHPPSHRFKHFFGRHTYAALNSLSQFSRSPLSSIMTCLVIGIALALPAGLFILLKNVEILSQHFQQNTQITLYLKKNSDEKDAHNVLRYLQNNKNIFSTQAISPTDGLAELQHEMGFNKALTDLSNPLPWTIVVIPRIQSTTSLQNLVWNLKRFTEVDTVQFDMLWVKRLNTIVMLGKRTIVSLGVFLCLAVLLIVNNAIRAATQANRKEIEVVKLIGGTSAFIRRPFLYAGILYGLLGGIFAWQWVDIFIRLLKSPMQRFSDLYDNSFTLVGFGLEDTLALLGVSLALGLLGSWFAVSRHLRLSN